jgi:hypothetical protein
MGLNPPPTQQNESHDKSFGIARFLGCYKDSADRDLPTRIQYDGVPQ